MPDGPKRLPDTTRHYPTLPDIQPDNQGLQNYRYLKMVIPITIPAEYDDTDTDTDTETYINAGRDANHSANCWRMWKFNDVLLFRKPLYGFRG